MVTIFILQNHTCIILDLTGRAFTAVRLLVMIVQLLEISLHVFHQEILIQMGESLNTSENTIRSFYRGKRILVIGGLGFMGQNLVRALVALGSKVRVVDQDSAVNRTLGDFPIGCTVYYANRCEKKLVDRAITDSEIIFNLAGRSGVNDSFQYPAESLKANCLQYLGVLQACQKHNPEAVVVFPSSCLVYGKNDSIHPLSPYAIHKHTCEMYSQLYRETYGLSTVVLRISNPIGPYQYRVDSSYGIYNRFIYLATNGYDITVYGEGSHARDIIGVDSVVQAFITCAMSADVVDIVDVGRGIEIPLCDYAQLVVDVVGDGHVTHTSWPKNIKDKSPTSFVADISRICSMTDWRPDTDLSAMITAAAEFYRWAENNSLIDNGEVK